MSTLKSDAITAATGTNTDLDLSGKGTGVPDIAAGFKVGSVAGVPTASIRDDAVTLAKLAAGTDGELITWDASGDPAAVAVGTATHVLTSNGAGAAPTFQAAAGGGSWTLISSTTASDDASITVTGITSTYASHAIFISDLVPASNDIRLYMRVGDSSGIDSGASDYSWRRDDNDGYNKVYAAENDTSDSEIELQTGAGNNTGEASHGRLYLMNPSGSSNYPFISGQMTSHSHTDMVWGGSMMAMRNAAITMDRFQLFYSSGNITSGRITLWGIANA